MKSEKLISIKCQTILNAMPDLTPTNKLLLTGLDVQYKGSVVARTFEVWAREHKYDELRKPITAFLKEAEDLLGSPVGSEEEPKDNPVVKKASREIAYLTDNQVALGPKHKTSLLTAIEEEEYTYDEVMTAFREFFQNLDTSKPNALSFAAKNFTDEASDRLYSVRRKKHEKEEENIAILRKAAAMQEVAEAERKARKDKQAEEELMIEDELGD